MIWCPIEETGGVRAVATGELCFEVSSFLGSSGCGYWNSQEEVDICDTCGDTRNEMSEYCLMDILI
eukprot:TRINITY_DN11133_c0_g1_i1.p2 TRINITY_DN11133_c0_g1~~TRINITY_DN11133_c0_g1_i1.p2  ORF type:complete len:66 (+),score=9.80 TRINITY_DN11133_c0_g1_i1:339-536(+)